MRRNTALTRIMASGVAAIMLCAGGTFTVNAAEEEPVKTDVSVKAIQGLSADFIGGMDVSSMLSLEESGVTFKNANGEVEDLFTLLKESGVNYNASACGTIRSPQTAKDMAAATSTPIAH